MPAPSVWWSWFFSRESNAWDRRSTIPSALRELQRVVRPGGALVLSIPAREFVAGRPGLYWSIRARVGRLPGLIHRLSEAELRAAVADFELLDLRREGGAHAVLLRNPEAL